MYLPKYLNFQNDPMQDPGPWYVVKSDTYNFSQELGMDLKPMFKGDTLEACKFYIASEIEKDRVRGYELYYAGMKHCYLVILRYQPSGLLLLGGNQYICYGAFSKKQAEAGKFITPLENTKGGILK